MDISLIYEIIGYVASVIIAVSLMMSNIIQLRVVNMIGAATFSLYGFLIGALPVALMNFTIVMINVYYLFKLLSSKESFQLLQVKPDSDYLASFLEHYKTDIFQSQPYFNFSATPQTVCVFVLRDMVPTGLIIGAKQDHEFDLQLDYVIPAYRDMKVGKYLYGKNADFFTSMGVTRIKAKKEIPMHDAYLKKLGFIEVNNHFELTLPSA